MKSCQQECRKQKRIPATQQPLPPCPQDHCSPLPAVCSCLARDPPWVGAGPWQNRQMGRFLQDFAQCPQLPNLGVRQDSKPHLLPSTLVVLLFYFIEVELIYNFMLISAIQQSGSSIYIYTHTHTHILFFKNAFPLCFLLQY